MCRPPGFQLPESPFRTNVALRQPAFAEGHLVDQTIAKLNIEHFRRLLKTETDPVKRATINHLLEEEEAKLRSINAEKDRKKRS